MEMFRTPRRIPKEITHQSRLKNIADQFEIFLSEVSHLGKKLGPLLCQLPPSLAFDLEVAEAAFQAMREIYDGMLVVEARHRSWARNDAVDLLKRLKIERVLADPAPVWTQADFVDPPFYIRLHGTPEIYYSNYTEDEIADFAKFAAFDSWIAFDNTALGHAAENALIARRLNV